MNLTLPFPPSANRYWRSKIVNSRVSVYKTTEARAYQELAYWTAKQQGAKPLKGPVILRGTIFFPNKRGDLSNRIKVVEDALQGAAYVNDSQVVRIDLSKAIDKSDPRVELEILEAV